jgi:hypothetical protein
MTFDADDSVAVPARVLSSAQLALLAERGEEIMAEVGEKLYEIADPHQIADLPRFTHTGGSPYDHAC